MYNFCTASSPHCSTLQCRTPGAAVPLSFPCVLLLSACVTHSEVTVPLQCTHGAPGEVFKVLCKYQNLLSCTESSNGQEET